MKKFIAIILILILSHIAGAYYFYKYCPDRSGVGADDKALAVFNDLNPKQKRTARKLGIEPLKNRDDAKKVIGKLVHIKTNDLYKVDRLTHSIPYLTKGGDELLTMIAKNFQDSLKSRGFSGHRIIVTSVLRTEEDVRRLRKSGNKNASINSAHAHATTFDITYARYDKCDFIGSFVRRNPSRNEMKMILADVLKDLRLQQKCYVKYETGQKCFHITSRIK